MQKSGFQNKPDHQAVSGEWNPREQPVSDLLEQICKLLL